MAAPASPVTRKGEQTRARLLDRARDEAIANGGRIEIAAVAERAGVVPSVIHRYFGSKAGMVSALVDDFFDRLHSEVLDADLEGEGGWAENEYLRLERGVAFHYADPLSPVLQSQLGREPEVALTESNRIATVIGQGAGNIRRAQKRGELPAGVDPELAAAAMFGAMTRVMLSALVRTPRPPQKKVVEVLWRQVAAAVQIDPASRPTEASTRKGKGRR
jgi:AcrR family transcriptional regulator